MLTNEERLERFWAKVDKQSSGCWIWTAAKIWSGYGRFNTGTRGVYAHRFSYELAYGPIPDGLFVDHICRNRACVNPEHMEVVTHRTNTLRGLSPAAKNARKRFCSQGHPFTAENTYTYRSPKTGKIARQCLTCRKQHADEWNAKVAAERVLAEPVSTCKHGHPFNEANTYYYTDGDGRNKRACKLCKIIRAREKYRRNTVAATAEHRREVAIYANMMRWVETRA